MSKLRLFIENQELELNDDVQFNITKQFEDLSNPTTIISDWSKTISIPFSQINNRIFGFYNVIDSLPAQSSSATPIGLNFDPNKRLNFRLQDGDSVLMMGYAKMNSVTQQDGKGAYNLTLNGQLGNLFKEMQKITFVYDENEDAKYYLDTRNYYHRPLSLQTLKDCWEGTSNDIIGYAPNNAKIDGFDYSSVDTINSGTKKFTEILEADAGRIQALGQSADTIIPNGLLPREFGDFRTYLQLPYIFWKDYWRIFQTKAEDLTGYTFNLDSAWFNENNIYWDKLVYMLKSYNPKEIVTNPLTVFDRIELVPQGDYYNISYDERRTLSFNVRFGEKIGETIVTKDYFEINGSTNRATLDTPIVFDLYMDRSNAILHNNIVVYYHWMTEDNRVIYTNKTLIVCQDGIVESEKKKYDNIIESGDYIKRPEGVNNSEYFFTTSISKVFTYEDIHNKFRGKVKCKIELQPIGYTGVNNIGWRFNSNDYTVWAIGCYTTPQSAYIGELTQPKFALISIDKWRQDPTRDITLNDLWNNEYNPFGEILKYCKVFNIYPIVDNVKKTIRFVQKNKYFSEHTIKKWDDIIDYSQPIEVEPLRGDSRYLLFNYSDSNDANNKAYKDRFGYNYGEIKVDNNNNFNNEQENVFEGCKSSIDYTPNILSWNRLFNDASILYYVPNETYVSCADKDGKIVDIFGTYFFYTGIKQFEKTAGSNVLRPASISIDTQKQQTTETYMYYEPRGTSTTTDPNSVSVQSYPNLSARCDNKWITFNTPKIDYVLNRSEEDVAGAPKKNRDIYNMLWKDYLNELYGNFNRKVTCYVKMNYMEFQSFSFNTLVEIHNRLYLVNKISDYNPNSVTTKVELISIYNLKAYTENNYPWLALSKYSDSSISGPLTRSIEIYYNPKYQPYVMSSNGFTNITISGNTLTYTISQVSVGYDASFQIGLQYDPSTKATFNLEGARPN